MINKIVIVEDEADIREMIEYNLKKEGYHVSSSDDGEDGLGLIKKDLPDLVLLDLMLPGMDGIEVCRRLKEESGTKNIPVVMVTAKGEEADIVLGLSLGADDYITKPFGIKVLLARVKTVLRRTSLKGSESDENEVIFARGLTINPARHKAMVDGEPVVFTAMEFKLLYFLASHPGRVFTRDQLLSRVSGEDTYVIDRNIDVHIRAIRKKLGPYRYLIDTIRRVGYRFCDEPEQE